METGKSERKPDSTLTVENIENLHKENKPIRSQTSEIRFGNMTYIVNTHYKENGRETAEQKLLRYVTKRISADLKNGKSPENKGEIHSF